MKSDQHHIKSPLNPIKIPLNRIKSYEILLFAALEVPRKARPSPPRRSAAALVGR